MSDYLKILQERDAKVLQEMAVIQKQFTDEGPLPTNTMLDLFAKYDKLNNLSYFLKSMQQALGKVQLLMPTMGGGNGGGLKSVN